MLIQLKPRENSLIEILFRKLPRVDALVLCEGKTESEVVKTIIKKLKFDVKKVVGVTDCEGINTLYSISSVMVVLTKLFKRIKTLGVVLDSEKLTVQERIKSFVDSLRAKGLKINEPQQVCHQTFVLCVENYDLKIYVSISGVHKFSNFKKHTIEDHGVLLLLLKNPNLKNLIGKSKTAQEIISKDTLLNLIRESGEEDLRKTFPHICCLLRNLCAPN